MGPEEIDKALSPEALTSAVMQRYHHIACRREMGAARAISVELAADRPSNQRGRHIVVAMPSQGPPPRHSGDVKVLCARLPATWTQSAPKPATLK